ncbi:kinase-like domain-containing protein [Umbelopsis sp. AD052]|nr:kinase-like domain-containing protein [Umbelopsis sp. AD052]
MQPSSQAVPASQLYTKLKRVGKGAYGSVYKGLDNKSGKVIAIKILNLDTAEDDVTDIQNEITLLSDLTRSESVNITPYHGCFLNKTKLWIIMDFAGGGSVRNLMKAGKIEEKYIAVIAREVLMALKFLHKHKIIHRDIKAANILMTDEGNIQLCDFGVAGQTSMNCLKRNSFVGTPYWMAPEVIREGALYDFKADIWSFGITIYEIATGNPPLANQDPMRAIIMIPRSKPPQLEGQFSAAIKEFVEQCVNEEPDERPSADDLLKSKFIRFASKTSSTILIDLIRRYEEWKQEQEAKRSSFTSQDMNNRYG